MFVYKIHMQNLGFVLGFFGTMEGLQQRSREIPIPTVLDTSTQNSFFENPANCKVRVDTLLGFSALLKYSISCFLTTEGTVGYIEHRHYRDFYSLSLSSVIAPTKDTSSVPKGL